MADMDNIINEIRSGKDRGGGMVESKAAAHSSPPAAYPATSPAASEKIINQTKVKDGFRKGSSSSSSNRKSSTGNYDTTGAAHDDSTDGLGSSTDALFHPSCKNDSSFTKNINFAKGSSAASIMSEDLCKKLKAKQQELDEDDVDTTKEAAKSSKEESEGGEEGGSASVAAKKRTCRTWTFWSLMVLVIPLITMIVFILPRAYYSSHLSFDNETETNGTQADFITYMSKLGYGKLRKTQRDSVVQTISKITELASIPKPEEPSTVTDRTPEVSEATLLSKVTEGPIYSSEEDHVQHESSKPTTEDYSLVQEASDKKILSSKVHDPIPDIISSSLPQDQTALNSDQIRPSLLRAVFDGLLKCRRGGDVVLLEFIDMYRNMMIFFGSFGGFANVQTQMLDNRIQNLELYTKRREGLQYETLKSMIHYEDTSQKIGSMYPFSGTILFTCLHRHLQFLALALMNIVHLQPQQPLLDAFKPAYETILSWHHTWFVVKFYQVGMALLPLKEEAIKRLRVTQGEDVMDDVLSASIRLVVNEVDKLTNLSEDILTSTDALKKIPEEVIT